MKITIIGDFFTLSGYGVHTRSIANALNNVGFDVRVECNKPAQWERYCTDTELKMCTKNFDNNSTAIMIGQPPSWSNELCKKYKKFIGFCVWEGDKIPDYWLDYLKDDRVDMIFVPSKHTENAIINTIKEKVITFPMQSFPMKNYLKPKIKIIPHGYDDKIMMPKPDNHKVFTFLGNKGWSQGLYDRGGVQWLLKAFSEEFTKKDKVRMIIKINKVYNPNINFKAEVKKIVDMNKNKAPCIFVVDDLTDEALCQLYNEGDVFVTGSMGDAFNIPCLEAMACGLPVITPIFGGMIDYISSNEGFFIDKGEYVNWSKELIYEDVKWFKPDINQLRKTMRYCYMHQKEIKEKGKNALIKSKNWTWNKTALKIKKILN